jgi:HK97 family phage major capsid protein
MTNVSKLRDERAGIWDEMQKVMATAEKDGWSGELEQTYDRLESDLDKKGDEIVRAEAFAKRSEEFDRVDRTGVVPAEPLDDLGDEPAKGYTDAFNRYMRNGISALDSSDQKVLMAGFVKGPQNAGGVATGAAGGYTVPPAFRQKIIERMTFVASMRQLAEVITTDTGAQLPWPTVDDTANEGAILAENTQVTEQDVTFGQASLDAYMYTSKLVRLSLQLLNDNAFGLEAWLANVLGARIGRVQNRHFTVGTGTGQPDGIITSASVGVTAASATAVTYDELVDLTESLDPAYLESGNSGFMMSQAARKLLRKLKDTQGRPLWEPSLQAGTPDTLMGYGLKLNNYMSAPATGVKSIGFGDIREAYLIRDVSDFALLRLNERYADYLQVGFLGFQRSDGTLQNASAFKVLQQILSRARRADFHPARRAPPHHPSRHPPSRKDDPWQPPAPPPPRPTRSRTTVTTTASRCSRSRRTAPRTSTTPRSSGTRTSRSRPPRSSSRSRPSPRSTCSPPAVAAPSRTPRRTPSSRSTSRLTRRRPLRRRRRPRRPSTP